MSKELKGFKKFANIFVDLESEDSTNNKQTTPANNETGASYQSTPQVTDMLQQNGGIGTIDKKFYAHFDQLFKEANLPGPDYFEFKQSLRNMANIGLSEDKLIMAAWGAYTANGGAEDKNTLIFTARQYIQIMEADKSTFLSDVQDRMKEKVGTLEKKVSDLENENKESAENIIRLQEKIKANNEVIGTTKGEISQSTFKIKNSENSYVATHDSYVSEIQNDINKIQLYIK